MESRANPEAAAREGIGTLDADAAVAERAHRSLKSGCCGVF